MAKNMVPMPTTKGAGSKILGALVFIALVVIIVEYPGEAARWAKDLVGLAGDAVDGLVSFIRDLAA